jgi:hypothetical protein
MGKKKKGKTTEYKTTTVTTKVVKLSYVQTLAWNAQLQDTTALETEAGQENLGSDSGGKGFSLPLNIYGKKKSTSTKTTSKTSGEKVIDQWLNPYFDRIRYSIGVKELTAARFTFKEASEFISTPFMSPKEIMKINIVTDEFIPPSFNQYESWFQYFIKVEGEGEDWVRINSTNAPTRFDESGLIIPKILNYNIPQPATAVLEDSFRETEKPVKRVRFRAVITRPPGPDSDSMTPLLKSYRILMTPKEMLEA